MARMIVGDQPVFVMSENDGYLKVYAVDSPVDLLRIKFQQNDWYFTYDLNGIKIREELYHGSGFLSSSSISVQIPEGVHEIKAYKYDGSHRKIILAEDHE